MSRPLEYRLSNLYTYSTINRWVLMLSNCGRFMKLSLTLFRRSGTALWRCSLSLYRTTPLISSNTNSNESLRKLTSYHLHDHTSIHKIFVFSTTSHDWIPLASTSSLQPDPSHTLRSIPPDINFHQKWVPRVDVWDRKDSKYWKIFS